MLFVSNMYFGTEGIILWGPVRMSFLNTLVELRCPSTAHVDGVLGFLSRCIVIVCCQSGGLSIGQVSCHSLLEGSCFLLIRLNVALLIIWSEYNLSMFVHDAHNCLGIGFVCIRNVICSHVV